jgi:hypothetical protein
MLAALNRLALKLDPSLILDELGFAPDDWQRTLLRSTARRMLVNVHRQGGKSAATAALAIGTAIHDPDSLILIVSRSRRQSQELYRKAIGYYDRLGRPVPPIEDNADTLGLANGSRIVCLPNNPDTIVGFSAPRLVILDEGARIHDTMLAAVSPMLTVGKGRMIGLSTPFGKRGWFWESWSRGGDDWERIEFRADRNPRIDPEFLASERRTLGDRWFAQEYLCSFEETVDQVFSNQSIDSAFDCDEVPLFGG